MLLFDLYQTNPSLLSDQHRVGSEHGNRHCGHPVEPDRTAHGCGKSSSHRNDIVVPEADPVLLLILLLQIFYNSFGKNATLGVWSVVVICQSVSRARALLRHL